MEGRFTPSRISRYAQRGHSVKRSSLERLTLNGSGEDGSNGARVPVLKLLDLISFGGRLEIGNDPRASIKVHIDAECGEVKDISAIIAIELNRIGTTRFRGAQ